MNILTKICDFVLKVGRVIYDRREHIMYASFISLAQIALILWYLHLKRPSDSLDNIEKGIAELTVGQKNIRTDIIEIKQKIIIMVTNDSVMDDQLKHYPAALPLALIDITRSSSVYGERIDPITGGKRFHWGIDYITKKGAPVYATANGKIERAEFDGEYGWMVKINHLNGYKSLYAHLNEIEVSMNQEIKKSELIGTVGNTGRSTGCHLHYEISYAEKHINPNIFRSPLKQVSDEKILGLINYRNFIASLGNYYSF